MPNSRHRFPLFPTALAYQRFFHRLCHSDISSLARAVGNRLFTGRAELRAEALRVTAGQNGLEIGGPSQVFGLKNLLPVYGVAASIDNVNFASSTAWESGLRDQGTFIFNANKPSGRQYLREATALHDLKDHGYDFLISSHCLEHVANPLAALREWRRVIRQKGYLLLLLPDPSRTFDRRRAITTLEHLREDSARETGEDDLTHLEEILQLHDLGRDFHAGTFQTFSTRAKLNRENRCLHHHVFDLNLVGAMLVESGWLPIACERVRPLHLIALAKNTGG